MAPRELIRVVEPGRRHAAAGALIFAVLACASPGRAHSVIVSRGDVKIEDERVRVQIRLTAADILHGHRPSPSDASGIWIETVRNAADELADGIADAPVVRDEAGARLARFSFTHEWTGDSGGTMTAGDLSRLEVAYTYEYRSPPGNRLITLHLDPAHVLPGVHWQVVLRVWLRGEEWPGVLRLTSRGNAETVELTPEVQPGRSADRCRMCDQRGSARFKDVCVDIEWTQARFVADVWIPMSLLSTWISIPSEDGFPDEHALGEAMEMFRGLVRKSMRVTAGDRVYEPEVTRAEFRPAVTPRSADGKSKRRISIWNGTARCGLKLEVEGLDHGSMRWELFNSAVLTAQATIRTASGCREHEFSTYSPTCAAE